MPSVPSDPEPLDGLFFSLGDLLTAMAWASVRPELSLIVATDHRQAPEVLEVYPPGEDSPRWRLWRDFTGRLHVDDCERPELDLSDLTVSKALRLIAGSLAE
jgi:hypothetical protein